MIDATHDLISMTTLELLKSKPASCNAERWVPRLVGEIERLRRCLAGAEEHRAP
jgi:hypothetical protein